MINLDLCVYCEKPAISYWVWLGSNTGTTWNQRLLRPVCKFHEGMMECGLYGQISKAEMELILVMDE